MNYMMVIQLLNAVILTGTQVWETIQKISEKLQQAQNEGRDVTKQELDAIFAETDALHSQVRARLVNLANQVR